MGRDFDDIRDSNHRSDTRHSFTVVNMRRECGLLVAVVAARAITAGSLRARGASTRSGWVVLRVARVRCFRVVLGSRNAHWPELSRRDGDHCPGGVRRRGAFADLRIKCIKWGLTVSQDLGDWLNWAHVNWLDHLGGTVCKLEPRLVRDEFQMVRLEAFLGQWHPGRAEPRRVASQVSPIVRPRELNWLA